MTRLGPTSRDSDSVGVEWGQYVCISDKLPDDAGASGPQTTLEGLA